MSSIEDEIPVGSKVIINKPGSGCHRHTGIVEKVNQPLTKLSILNYTISLDNSYTLENGTVISKSTVSYLELELIS